MELNPQEQAELQQVGACTCTGDDIKGWTCLIIEVWADQSFTLPVKQSLSGELASKYYGKGLTRNAAIRDALNVRRAAQEDPPRQF